MPNVVPNAKTFRPTVALFSFLIATGAVARPVFAQPSVEASEAALGEVWEALREDSAELDSRLAQPINRQADRQQPDVQVAVPAVYLLEQALTESLNTAHKAPGANALGEPMSVGIETQMPVEIEAVDWDAIAASFRAQPTTLPALTTALNSEDELTRLYAADALWSLTGDSDLVLPTLISAAESENTDTRELALMALAQLGEEALPAIPVLRDIVGERDSRTRQIAQDVLQVVQSENRPATVLGIIAREADRMGGFSALFKAISNLW